MHAFHIQTTSGNQCHTDSRDDIGFPDLGCTICLLLGIGTSVHIHTIQHESNVATSMARIWQPDSGQSVKAPGSFFGPNALGQMWLQVGLESGCQIRANSSEFD